MIKTLMLMTSTDLISQQLHSYMIGNLRSDLMLNRGENDNPEDESLKWTLAYSRSTDKMVIGGHST